MARNVTNFSGHSKQNPNPEEYEEIEFQPAINKQCGYDGSLPLHKISRENFHIAQIFHLPS